MKTNDSNDETETATPTAPALAKARAALHRAMDETDDARARDAAAARQQAKTRERLEAAERAEATAFDDLAVATAAKRLEAQP